MKTNDSNQLSLFQVLPSLQEDMEQTTEDKIAITKEKFLSQELSTYDVIFRGYNELRVITYSYALSFIEDIMRYFDRGEVIIGFDKLINKNAAELLALQEFSTNFVCHNSYLQKRIHDDEFRFYVLNDLVSHQKIYLLKADDGRVRTITGSANFSERAWTGEQIECVTVCDDPECYELYASQYETLQLFATAEISKNAIPIEEDGENADELPFFKKIEKDNAIVLHDSQNEEEQEYAFHADKLDKEWEDRLKAIKLKPSKDGKILFEIKHMKTLLGAIRKDNARKKERQLINPQFILDFDNHTALHNHETLNLSHHSPSAKKQTQKLK